MQFASFYNFFTAHAQRCMFAFVLFDVIAWSITWHLQSGLYLTSRTSNSKTKNQTAMKSSSLTWLSLIAILIKNHSFSPRITVEVMVPSSESSMKVDLWPTMSWSLTVSNITVWCRGVRRTPYCEVCCLKRSTAYFPEEKSSLITNKVVFPGGCNSHPRVTRLTFLLKSSLIQLYVFRFLSEEDVTSILPRLPLESINMYNKRDFTSYNGLLGYRIVTYMF